MDGLNIAAASNMYTMNANNKLKKKDKNNTKIWRARYFIESSVALNI